MSLLTEVVAELSQFAIEALFKRSPKPSQKNTDATQATGIVPVTEHTDDLIVTKESPTFKTVAEVVAERPAMVAPTPPIETGSVVVCSKKTPLFLTATKEFDAVLDTVMPGRILRVDTVRGHWVFVAYANKKGWVARDAVVDHEGAVQPYFVLREYCGPETENTVRLRSVIDDEFSGGLCESPLRGEEYVYYQLLKRGLSLPVVFERPRLAGTWHEIFKGRSGVHIGVRPKTGSIMEWLDGEGSGRVAYVEAVLPDESLNITMVGEPEDGYYLEATWQKEEWQERSPVFIQFS